MLVLECVFVFVLVLECVFVFVLHHLTTCMFCTPHQRFQPNSFINAERKITSNNSSTLDFCFHRLPDGITTPRTSTSCSLSPLWRRKMLLRSSGFDLCIFSGSLNVVLGQSGLEFLFYICCLPGQQQNVGAVTWSDRGLPIIS